MPINKLTFLKPNFESELRIPYIDFGVSAGFPSPAMDFMETAIDLNKALSENPLATFYIKVDGNSMIDAGINDKDVLVVDGEFTVKRIQLKKNELWLMPENPKYNPIKINEENQLIVWGIVTYVIKKV